MKHILFVISFLLFNTGISATEDPGNEAIEIWDQLLKKYVGTNGMVDYAHWKEDPQMARVIKLFASQHPKDTWSKTEIMAYWINVYNAYTVNLILDNFPLKSITDLDKPWDTEFIHIQGRTYSLNQIEHEILRKKYKDPRIHFAVNCASFSCPKLLNTAFRAENLNAQLEARAKEFINDKSRNRISPNQIAISKLFDWYKEDFTIGGGSVIDYLNKYAATKINPTAELSYLEYNWSLNNK